MEPVIRTMSVLEDSEPEVLFDGAVGAVTLPHYTWDGGHIVFESGVVPKDVVALRADGSGDLVPVANGPGNETQAVPSPAGPWVAYTSDETGRNEVYITRLEGRIRIPVSNGGGLSPQWSPGGDSLYFSTGQDLWVAALSLEGDPRVLSREVSSTVTPLVETVSLPAQYDIHPVGIVGVGATAGGSKIVVRTHYLPSNN